MKLSEFVAAIAMPALLIDRTERISHANTDCLNLLGSRITGRHFATSLRQPQVAIAIETCLRTRAPMTARYQVPSRAIDQVFDLTCRYISGNSDADVDPDSVSDGWVLVCFSDITAAHQIGRMHSDFVANVSHELRTPLTAMMGFIETLQGAARDDPEAQARFLTIMDGEATRMNGLVSDLLSLSRVESDERQRPTEMVQVDQMLVSTVNSLRPVIDAAGVSLDLSLPETFSDKSIQLRGDLDQLKQVFTNLIENAIKYGASGGDLSGGKVDVSLRVVDHDSGLRGPAAVISVTDYGSGIDPRHLPRLTERFYRVDGHRARAVGGTGLGLAIAKHIINRHRGRLRIDSTVGEGSSFIVSLPL
jgi:two-component system phosphate regulon sensor histidine kinase PhoR